MTHLCIVKKNPNDMKQILVPTDFSLSAENAFKVACEIAKKHDSRLVVFNVYGVPYSSSSVMIDLTDVLKETAEKAMSNFLKKFIEEYPSLEIEGACSFGAVSDTIAEKAKDFDLVVMGTNGSSGLEEVFIGSHTSNLVQRVSDTPVLAIPSNFTVGTCSSALLAVSGSSKPKSETFEKLNSLFEQLDITNVDVLNVQKEDKTNENEIERLIKTVNTKLKDTKHTFSFLGSDDVENAILKHAKPEDLIVVVTKNYSFFEGLFHKSISKKLAMHSKNPLLIIKEN
jgi:nucleotide-binding universal stress UspA family protein